MMLSFFCLQVGIPLLFFASAGTNEVIAHDTDPSNRLPALFTHGLIFLEPVSQDGDTLRFFTDTADGTMMYQDDAERLGLITTSAIIDDQQQKAVFLPVFETAQSIPAPLLGDGLIPLLSDDRKPPHHRAILEQEDGILGSTWFAMRTWSVNYRDETMALLLEENVPDVDSESIVPLSFRKERGEIVHYFAGIETVIAGDTLSMVLKSGSHIILSEEVRLELDHPDPLFPVGLISGSVFEKWKQAHPDWPVYEGADIHHESPVIEVPEVTIGPHTSETVRFAVRPEETFRERFSQFTAEPVVGALGPDAFRNSHIILDYVNKMLIFQNK